MNVTICDVGPRDGLQNEDTHLEPEVRAELVNRLAAAGLGRIEAVSFVKEMLVPQMAGAEEVVRGLDERDSVVYAGLVLNEKGYDRLLRCGLREAHFAFGATETFNRRNQNSSVEDSIAAASSIIQRARGDGVRVSVAIGVAFGCPFEGQVEPERVLTLAERVVAAGADELLFADTIGVAVPQQVRHLVFQGAALALPVGVHLHNTRGTGIANALAALENGATILDASVGGTGGCPFAPRATGNIATEDLVYMLHGEGVATGIDLGALIGVAEWFSSALGKELPGLVYRAGGFEPVAS